jgi:glutamate racemase
MAAVAPEHAIGVFDSGVGGLTVLKALLRELPGENFIYLGDTARLPYGTKSPTTVVRYALAAAEALMALRLKCLVIACNTASAVALAQVRARVVSVPVIGVIEPGAEAACASSTSGHIAVIGTEGTIRGGAYQEAIRRRRPQAQVAAAAAPLFVALAEEDLCEGPIAAAVAHHYLDPLLAGAPRTDTLVLGCTHFPMLRRAIEQAVGPGLAIVDSAQTTAGAVRCTLAQAGILAPAGVPHGSLRLLATDAPQRFAQIGARFLERRIAAEDVEAIDL